jgi:hypothetical protein
MSFIDDDDQVTDAYIEDLRDDCRVSMSCVFGVRFSEYAFTHSTREHPLGHDGERDDVFLRPPNHLNPMLTDVAKLVHFGDAVRGEDLDWTIRLSTARVPGA